MTNIPIDEVFRVQVTALLLYSRYNPDLPKQPPELEQTKVISYLQEHDLKNGFGTFTYSGSITAISEFENRVAPVVVGQEGQYVQHGFFSKNEWYSEFANYLIVGKVNEGGVNYESAVERFGEPVYTHDFGAGIILVFDYDISTKIDK